MKISELDMRCGECSLVDFCGEPFEYCICKDLRYKDIEEEEFLKEQEGNIDSSNI